MHSSWYMCVIEIALIWNVMVKAENVEETERGVNRQPEGAFAHVHDYDSDTFRIEVLRRPHFVMFHAPGCESCEQLLPILNLVGKKFHDNTPVEKVVIAKVTCNSPNDVCRQIGIDAFPTLALFKNSLEPIAKFSEEYDLGHFSNFITTELQKSTLDDQVPEVPGPGNGVFELTEETFESHIASGHHFIKFFAPWCGHCQRLAPVWEELAASYSHSKWLTVGKVDCTAFWAICQKYEVRSYPTLLFFHDGMKIADYNGARDHNSLKQYVSSMKYQQPMNEGQNEIQDHVLELTADTFHESTVDGANIIKFYDPMCGHCNELAPTWKNLASQLAGGIVRVSRIDCTMYRDLCIEQNVFKHPTIIFFKDGNRLDIYRGPTDIVSLVQYASEMAEKEVDDVLPEQESYVVEMTLDNYDEYIGEGFVFVEFFVPWCGFCKSLSPVWEEVAKKFVGNDLNLLIAKMDCSVSVQLCDKNKIQGYPSMFLYKDGTKKDMYTGSHDLESIYNYVTMMIRQHKDEL